MSIVGTPLAVQGSGCQTSGVSAPEEPTTIQVPVHWPGLADLPTLYVNQFAATLGPPTVAGMPDGVYVLLGNVAPPVVLGTSAAAREASLREAQDGINVKIHGRYYLTRERLGELIDSLTTIADAYDKVINDRSQK